MSLVDLDDVGTTRSFAYEEPTLQTPGRYTARTPMTSASFKKLFFRTFPELEAMDWSNVCIRGGAVVDLLLARPVRDLDLFFYGLPDGDAVRARAAAVLAFLLKVERDACEKIVEAQRAADRSSSGSTRGVEGFSGYASRSFYSGQEPHRIDISATRRGSVVTVSVGAVRCPLQIVLCGYASREALAAGADMAVCGTIFDGERVLATADGCWSLENMAIRIPNDRFPRMSRLSKYFDKGFDVVLPGLDVSKIPRGYLALGLTDAVVTPAVRFSYTEVKGNRITLTRFLLTDAEGKRVPEAMGGEAGEDDEAGAVRARGKYDSAADAGLSDRRGVIYDNLALLAAYTGRLAAASAEAKVPVPDFAVFAEADYVGDVMRPWPSLTPRQVENTYAGILGSIWDGASLSLGPLARFVTTITPRAVLGAIAATPETSSVEDETARVVGEAVEGQKMAASAALPALTAYFADKVAPVLSPEAMFSSSLVRDAAVFYGEYKK